MIRKKVTIFVKIGSLTGIIFLLGALTACTSVFFNQSDDKNSNSTESLQQSGYGMIAIGSDFFQKRSMALQADSRRSVIGKPYQINGKWYYPEENPKHSEKGLASWYGPGFHGKLTANGETFNMNYLTAAHTTMPLPSYARVTNLKNGTSLVVRVNDRGPFAQNRIIDLSRRAAQLLGYQHSGLANVEVEYIGPAPIQGQDNHYLLSSFKSIQNNNAVEEFTRFGVELTQENQRVFSIPSSAVHENMPTLPEHGPYIAFKPLLFSAFSEEKMRDCP